MASVRMAIARELSAQRRKNFKRSKVIVKNLNDMAQADLMDVSNLSKYNRNVKFILVYINAFSKKTYLEPLKSKSGPEVAMAMEKILSRVKHAVKLLNTDKGNEFRSKEMKAVLGKHNIKLYHTYSELKAVIVERVIRQLRRLISMHQMENATFRYIDDLQSINDQRNNTVHHTTKIEPNKVTKRNEKDIFETTYNYKIKYGTPRYRIGEYVRVSRPSKLFKKETSSYNWSTELFVIRQVSKKIPITYLLRALNKEDIEGRFYEPELKKTNHVDVYLVEKILKRKGNKILVSWLGFPETTWINKNQLID
jgi:hypothetical protein